MTSKATKETKTKSAKIRLISPNLIENIIQNYAGIDAEDVLEIKEMNKEIAEGKRYAVLFDTGEYTSFTKEARELASSKEFVGDTIAKALLVRSLGHRIVANFYININKPVMTTKVFEDRDKAINWLNEQIQADK